MSSLFPLILSMLLSLSYAGHILAETEKKQGGSKEKIIKYKEFEKYEFDDLEVEGEKSGDGNLSISSRESLKFKNELPLKKDFHFEMRRSIENLN